MFDSLLQVHVDSNGLADYQGFEKDHDIFQTYLESLRAAAPADTWTANDRLAYWINTYNAFTIELILQYKPAHSIKDITAIDIPFINSPWQINFITIGEATYNLDDIEHGIIRKEFDEPRIHFALVCAARSCPKLRREAYTGDKLEEQLAGQARSFLADTARNQVSAKHVRISKIFQWYKNDFTKNESLIDFLNRHAPVEIDDNARVTYMDYDWTLNTRSGL